MVSDWMLISVPSVSVEAVVMPCSQAADALVPRAGTIC